MAREILVVDDSLTVRVQLRSMLLAAGYAVTEASDGQAALEKATAKSFDLVITDLNMPELDGFELIKSLRLHPKTVALPIIVLSTRDADQDLDRAIALGANSYLNKPVQQAELVTAVTRHLG